MRHTQKPKAQKRTTYKRLPIKVIPAACGVLAIIGTTHQTGTYVLRLRVSTPVGVVQHMQKERPVVLLAPGDYYYVGSGQNGLGNRVLRHATRSGSLPPQPIREIVVNEFRRLNIDCGDERSRKVKNVGVWFVEHVLDRVPVALISAYLIRWPRNLERDVGELLQGDPATEDVKRGLGGGEYRGKLTLLRRVKAEESWWQKLPDRLAKHVLVATLNRVHHPLVDGLVGDGRLVDKDMIKLLNMWHERATDILRSMVNEGLSFPKADALSKDRGIFDTHDWQEVASRMARVRGDVRKAIATLRNNPLLIGPDSQRRCVIERIKQIKAGVRRLRRVVSAASKARKTTLTDTPTLRPFDGYHVAAATFPHVAGWLKTCEYFLTKSARDLPLVRKKTAKTSSPAERAVIRWELDQIEETTDTLLNICEHRST